MGAVDSEVNWMRPGEEMGALLVQMVACDGGGV